MFCDAAKHARPNFFAIVERKCKVRPADSLKYSVRPALPFNLPADRN